ncbi:hypothetical protein SDC9_143739 [bioreactor metagenome]|uniref:Uncharacterized protein n=1 Tax=bioreactor metagenome TaxID=1076179 RepID=A0A645E4Z2_9ZZZZ
MITMPEMARLIVGLFSGPEPHVQKVDLPDPHCLTRTNELLASCMEELPIVVLPPEA